MGWRQAWHPAAGRTEFTPLERVGGLSHQLDDWPGRSHQPRGHGRQRHLVLRGGAASPGPIGMSGSFCSLEVASHAAMSLRCLSVAVARHDVLASGRATAARSGHPALGSLSDRHGPSRWLHRRACACGMTADLSGGCGYLPASRTSATLSVAVAAIWFIVANEFGSPGQHASNTPLSPSYWPRSGRRPP